MATYRKSREVRGADTEDPSGQLKMALQILAHYHIEHTDDVITRFRNRDIVIYITRDPEAAKNLADATVNEFPAGDGVRCN